MKSYVAIMILSLFFYFFSNAFSQVSHLHLQKIRQSDKVSHKQEKEFVGNKYALIVGVSNYQDNKVDTLRYADKDARDFTSQASLRSRYL